MKKDVNKYILAIGILIAIILPSVFLLSTAYREAFVNAENGSQFGDFIGGYVGTTLSFISIIFIVISLNWQRQADKQNLDSLCVEKFENKFFEMIRLHRDHVQEIGFSYGVGPNSSRILKCALKQYDKNHVELLLKSFDSRKTKEKVKPKRNLKYILLKDINPGWAIITGTCSRRFPM